MNVATQLKQLRALRKGRQDRLADAITRFSGSMAFVYLHIVWFGIWLIINTVAPHAFDPFPFGLLTLIVSLEAIFLSTFVLISQNRQGERSQIRERLDFETNVQSEVWTEMLAERLGIDHDEVKRRVRQRISEANRTADQESPAQ